MLFGKFLISNPEEMIIFAIITNINQKTNIMKRFFAILSVVMLAGLLACAAPKKKSRVKKSVNKTAKKAASKTQKTAVPKEVLLEFRLEYQAAANRNCSSSAVMSCSQGNYGDYVYYRALGDNEAMSYDFAKGVCTSLMLELSRIAEHKHLSSNKFTKLDDEDITKPRWLVTMKNKDGKEYSMVEYSDGSELLQLVEAAFKPIMEKVEKGELKAPYSHYHYNSDGSLYYRTDHTEDGTVHGGYNPSKPDATF